MAAERTVVVVLDRSASLRHADPDDRGPRLLALALGLSMRPGERLAVFATGRRGGEPISVGDDAASLAVALRTVFESPVQVGGADLRHAFGSALKAAGAGVVIVFTDDDLDVVSAGGVVPAAILKTARAKHPRPTRADVNDVAAQLLVAQTSRSKASVLGLRAQLPPGARVTPFLKRLGANTVDLAGSDLAVVAELAERVRGEPVVSGGVSPASGTLELPYPARVAIVGTDAVDVPGAASVDGRSARLWLTDAVGSLAIKSGKPVQCLVSPRLDVPTGVVAYGLRNGSVRVVALGEGSPNTEADRLVARIGDEDAPLEGSPPAATLNPAALPTSVALLRVLKGAAGRSAVAGHGRVGVTPAEVVLTVAAQPEAQRRLEVRGQLPAGLSLESLPIEVREASGGLHQIDLKPSGEAGKLVARVTPRSAGRLRFASQGALAVRLSNPVVVQESVRRLVVIEALADAEGVGLTSERPVAVSGGMASLRLSLAIDPEPPEPFAVEVTLKGAPVGAHFETTPPISVQGKTEATLILRWPDAAGTADVSIRCREVTGAAVPATRTFRVKPPVGPKQALVAAALIAIGLLWFVAILRRRAKRTSYLLNVIGDRQLRTVGSNGRLSHETYLLRDYVGADNSIVVEPEASPGGAVAFSIREDGAVDCEGLRGAKVIHSARPAIVAESIILRHGTPFAMLCGDQALRYVYLNRQPTADEIQTPYLADAASQEAKLQDSGIYLILDQEAPVLPRYSARLDASQEMVFPPPPEDAPDTSDEIDVIPPSSDTLGLSSDEGRIMDSQEINFLESQDGAMAGGLQINMSDLMPREDLDADDEDLEDTLGYDE